jgi:membrane fusion protein (multidrug efflux system)
LQNLDPIFIDFNIPQQQIDNIKVSQDVTVYVDPYKKQKFIGKITSINPKIDVDTRNVMVEAQIDNPDKKLLPGMFAKVEVNVDAAKKYLTLPKTAISFNSYGDLVYIVELKKTDKGDNTKQIATQKFVTVGESRGNRIAILSGIGAHDEVVTSGQLKLKNGTVISINNSIIPDDNPSPMVMDE